VEKQGIKSNVGGELFSRVHLRGYLSRRGPDSELSIRAEIWKGIRKDIWKATKVRADELPVTPELVARI
jgi:hypothetical protein